LIGSLWWVHPCPPSPSPPLFPFFFPFSPIKVITNKTQWRAATGRAAFPLIHPSFSPFSLSLFFPFFFFFPPLSPFGGRSQENSKNCHEQALRPAKATLWDRVFAGSPLFPPPPPPPLPFSPPFPPPLFEGKREVRVRIKWAAQHNRKKALVAFFPFFSFFPFPLFLSSPSIKPEIKMMRPQAVPHVFPPSPFPLFFLPFSSNFGKIHSAE